MRRSILLAIAPLCVAGFTAAAGPPGAYGFCESADAATNAYVTPVFPLTLDDPTTRFESYLAERYALRGDKARCFTLSSEREADAFRVQRIELLHWDGWQHVIATHWTPDADRTVAHRAEPSGRDTTSG